MRHACKPIREFEERAITEWRAETQPSLRANTDMLQAQLTKLKKAAAVCMDKEERKQIHQQVATLHGELEELEAQMQPPVLIVEDVTTEVLVVLLSKRGETLASISSDAGSIINNLLGRYAKDRTDEAIYLKTWTGEPYRVHRIGRQSVTLKRPCMTALWLVQPDKIDTLLTTDAFMEGGLVPRLLVCHTGCQPKPIVETSIGIPALVEENWRLTAWALLESFRFAKEPWLLEPTPEASAIFRDHYNSFVSRWHSGELRDISSFAARWTEQAWRIAVCLHAGTNGEQCVKVRMDEIIARNAVAIADWFAGEQLRILAGRRTAGLRNVKDRVFELAANRPLGIRASDVYRGRITRDAETAHRLLQQMEANGVLKGRDEKRDTGGHVTRIYTLNNICMPEPV